jgi:hypothetical protein
VSRLQQGLWLMYRLLFYAALLAKQAREKAYKKLKK